MEIVPERGWDDLKQELLVKRGITMMIGTTDSGKSTLTRYVLRELLAEGARTAVVDSDVGQSSLGLPGTLGMKVFCAEEDLTAERMFFVGTANPARRVPQVLYGTKKFTDISRKKADITLIDTCGLVAGEAGRSLKVKKIRAVRPDRVVALQRRSELEHILSEVEDVPSWRMKVSCMARVRGVRERRRYRQERLSHYFGAEGASRHVIETEGLSFSDGIAPVFGGERVFGRGTVIGLNRGEETVALGVIHEFTSEFIAFTSPLVKKKKFDRVIFGDATLQCLTGTVDHDI